MFHQTFRISQSIKIFHQTYRISPVFQSEILQNYLELYAVIKTNISIVLGSIHTCPSVYEKLIIVALSVRNYTARIISYEQELNS